MNSYIPVVVAFTENYFVPAITCLSSIIKNSDPKYKYEVICLLTKDLPLDLQEKLNSYNPDRMKFTFLNLDGALEGVYVDERYTIAASFRLLLPELLKEHDKIIYTDCDVIIRNDLGSLYENIKLGNNYLAAVYEAALDSQISYLKEIGCEPGYYFNSGFLVMNLDQMRKDGLSKKLIDGLKVPYLQFPDQDVLNIHTKGRVLALKPKYNGIRTFFLPQFKSTFLKRYTEKDWDEVQSHGTIHYTGGKPWNEMTVKFEIWWKYYFQLPKHIKASWQEDKKLSFIGKCLNFPLVGYLGLGIIDIYRKVKHMNSN